MARSSKKSRKSKSRVVTIPGMKDVEAFKLIPEGRYAAKVFAVDPHESQTGNEGLKWVFQITKGKFEDAKPMPYYTSFAEGSLFNLKGLLEALEVEVPDEPEELDLDDLIDTELAIQIEHEEWEGKDRPKVVDFGVAGSEDEDDGDKKKKKKGKKDDDDGEEDRPSKKDKKKDKKKKKEKFTQEQINEMDEDELEEFVKDHELDVDLDDFKSLRKKAAAVIDAATDEDLIEDDE